METEGLAVPVLIASGVFMLTTISAIGLKYLRVPYTIGLVLIGMILGLLANYSDFLAPLTQLTLSRDLIMYVLLPVLVYGAAINIKLPMLVNELVPVLMLAIVGVVLSTLVVAGVMTYFGPMAMAGALLFGALISATDPVAVIALFQEVGAPERMSLLMDAESLFNDATAMVMFGIVMTVIQTGQSVDAAMVLDAVLAFFRVFLGGVATGVVLGGGMLLFLRLGRHIPFVQIAHTTILAYASFIVADEVFAVSGVMATIAAGIVTRTWSHQVLSESARDYLYPYWEFVAFVANSFIFLLLGLQEDVLFLDMGGFYRNVPLLMLAIAAVLLARFLVVYLLIPVSNRLPKSAPVDGPTRLIMFWGGLRGVVPVALMLAIPESLPERPMIFQMTLAVILFSLLVQGATIERLMGMLKLKSA